MNMLDNKRYTCRLVPYSKAVIINRKCSNKLGYLCERGSLVWLVLKISIEPIYGCDSYTIYLFTIIIR